jgi:hypothetical protein
MAVPPVADARLRSSSPIFFNEVKDNVDND